MSSRKSMTLMHLLATQPIRCCKVSNRFPQGVFLLFGFLNIPFFRSQLIQPPFHRCRRRGVHDCRIGRSRLAGFGVQRKGNVFHPGSISLIAWNLEGMSRLCGEFRQVSWKSWLQQVQYQLDEARQCQDVTLSGAEQSQVGGQNFKPNDCKGSTSTRT